MHNLTFNKYIAKRKELSLSLAAAKLENMYLRAALKASNQIKGWLVRDGLKLHLRIMKLQIERNEILNIINKESLA